MFNELKCFFAAEGVSIDLDMITKRYERDINKLKKKGEIKNEIEYQFVLDYIDNIYAYPDKKSEVDFLNGLLLKFEATR